jgi:hypothetical protein
MDNWFVIGLASWVFPGAGHLMQKRIARGLIIGGAIFSGGAFYPGFSFSEGALLSLLNIFARWGNGLGAIISYVIASQPSANVAAAATFEYGGRFLETAGLLNYLALIDAVDIHLGRKK